jgi:putative hemolysin
MPRLLETEPCSRSSRAIIYFLPLFAAPEPSVFLALLLLILLLYGSAMVSGSEVAFFSLTHNDYARLREEGTRNANRILILKEKPRTLLATILISNNFINIAIVLLSNFILGTFFKEATFFRWAEGLKENLTFLGEVQAQTIAGGINFIITVVGVTFLLVLFGEVAPKIYAKLNNIQLAKFMSGPLIFLMNFFNPFSRLLVKGTNIIERKLERRNPSNSVTSKEDIDEAIEITVQHEKNARQEMDILKSIVKFGDVTVKQIMKSRVDIIAVEYESSFDEVLNTVKESGYSRIPVYREEIDDVKGILYAKDLLAFLDQPDKFEWQILIRPSVLFVPESKKINDMLKEFQIKRMHLAVVVDEYGGTSGIVTLEDILEEVIGEIRDEFDDEEEVDYKKLDEYTFVFEGKTLLNDVCRTLNLDTSFFDEARGDSDTLAGLVLELAGHIPKQDEVYHYNSFEFKVVAVGKKRVQRVQVSIPKEE